MTKEQLLKNGETIEFETRDFMYYYTVVNGQKILMAADRWSNRIYTNAHHLAKLLGFKTVEEMLSSDSMLDGMNEAKKATKIWPLVKDEETRNILIFNPEDPENNDNAI